MGLHLNGTTQVICLLFRFIRNLCQIKTSFYLTYVVRIGSIFVQMREGDLPPQACQSLGKFSWVFGRPKLSPPPLRCQGILADRSCFAHFLANHSLASSEGFLSNPNFSGENLPPRREEAVEGPLDTHLIHKQTCVFFTGGKYHFLQLGVTTHTQRERIFFLPPPSAAASGGHVLELRHHSPRHVPGVYLSRVCRRGGGKDKGTPGRREGVRSLFPASGAPHSPA